MAQYCCHYTFLTRLLIFGLLMRTGVPTWLAADCARTSAIWTRLLWNVVFQGGVVGFQLDSCWIPVGFLLDSNGFLSESGYLSDLIEKLYLCCYMYIYALLILDLNAVWLPGRPGPLTSIGLGQATFLASPCHTYLQGGGQQQPNYTTTNNQPTTNNRPTTNNQGRQQQQQNNMQQTHPCPMHRAQGRIIPFGGTPHSHPSSILQGGTYYSSGMNRLCSHGMQYIATRFDIKHTLHKPKRYNI